MVIVLRFKDRRKTKIFPSEKLIKNIINFNKKRLNFYYNQLNLAVYLKKPRNFSKKLTDIWQLQFLQSSVPFSDKDKDMDFVIFHSEHFGSCIYQVLAFMEENWMPHLIF